MQASKVRQEFLDFFQGHEHKVVPSSALVPAGDPTLLFTNAGMVQFKDVFTGRRKFEYPRAASSQKCLRVSGKHNDLEVVGRTPRHHTFFEMLGNFSFGDYFKEKAISLSWEFLTQVMGFPADRLWVSVFQDDDEAYDIWLKKMAVPKERILRLDEKDNFWSMGEVGPCGPCSEIHWDRGSQYGNDLENRLMEVWNLVFMQYDRGPDGTLVPLPKPSIDTGMGLERLVAVVQGAQSNYDTDLFLPLIKLVGEIARKRPGHGAEDDVSMRVIADHARATAFLIGDGVFPENEGRGYVLRRIMRRAIRHGKRLGLQTLFFHKVCLEVVSLMGDAFPELTMGRTGVERVVQQEEELFRNTLDRGLELIEKNQIWILGDGKKVMPGEVAFKLYDTFGFPPDLTRVIGEERGFVVDLDGFTALMENRREISRSSWKGATEKDAIGLLDVPPEAGATEFVGYEKTSEENARLLFLLKDNVLVERAVEGDQVALIFDSTPFYAESGGQVGDKGVVLGPNGKADVTDTNRSDQELIVHFAKVTEGGFSVGDEVALRVNTERRLEIQRSHSATHLLHNALRRRLGEHVKQKGSAVEPGRLRFDFSHFSPLSEEDIVALERDVNGQIMANAKTHTAEMVMEQAIQSGALAFFEDKYKEKVRVVRIGTESVELCGGTHVGLTGDIGLFYITGESGIAAGVRRIEAVTGDAAVSAVQNLRSVMDKMASALKVSPQEARDRLDRLQQHQKALEKELDSLKKQLATKSSVDLMDRVRQVAGICVLATRVDGLNAKQMRELGDKLKDRLKSGIVVLMGELDGKVVVMVMVTSDLVGDYPAGSLVKKLAPMVGGRGGGKAELAQAGGDAPEGIDEALAKIDEIIAQS